MINALQCLTHYDLIRLLCAPVMAFLLWPVVLRLDARPIGTKVETRP
jgi:hypothetical protein